MAFEWISSPQLPPPPVIPAIPSNTVSYQVDAVDHTVTPGGDLSYNVSTKTYDVQYVVPVLNVANLTVTTLLTAPMLQIHTLNASPTFTNTVGWDAGVSARVSVEPTVDQAFPLTYAYGRTFGGNFFLVVPSTNTANINMIQGVSGQVEHYGTGYVNMMIGAEGWAWNVNAANAAFVFGVGAYSDSDGGNVADLVGVDEWSGVYGGVVQNHCGVRIRFDHGGGTIVNRYGLLFTTPTGSATNDYGIYQAGTQKNYFGGPIGIGVNPVARLEIQSIRTYGVGSPTYKESSVEVHGNADEYPTYAVYAYGGILDYEYGQYICNRARGARSSPSPTIAGDTLGTLNARGYNSTLAGYGTVGQILFLQTANTTTTGNPGAIVFQTNDGSQQYNGLERMRIDANGKVGIGNTAPPAQLYVRAPTSAYNTMSLSTPGYTYLQLLTDDGEKFELGMGGGGTYIWNWTANNISFATNNTTRMTLTANGQLGLGLSTPAALLEAQSTRTYGVGTPTYRESGIEVHGNADEYPHVSVYAYGGTVDYEEPQVILQRARGTRTTPTPPITGDYVGTYHMRGYNATLANYSTVAAISGVQTGANTASGNPGAMYFTTNDGSNRWGTVRMQLTANGMLDIWNTFGRGAPITKTSDFTLASNENWIINNKSGSTCTVTFPAASLWSGREVMIKTIQAQTVVSAAANVVPLNGGAASTAILAATIGKWATLVSDGTNWVIMQAN